MKGTITNLFFKVGQADALIYGEKLESKLADSEKARLDLVALYDNELAKNAKLEKQVNELEEITEQMLDAGAKMFEQTLHSSADFKHHAYHVFNAMILASKRGNNAK